MWTSEDVDEFLMDGTNANEANHQLFLLPAIQTSLNNSTTFGQHCSPRILQLSIWLISIMDIVLTLLAIPFNALLVPSAFFARPIPFGLRRSLSAIALSYALLAGILLAKKCFWLYSTLNGGGGKNAHCAPMLSSVACKLQEFPVVFIFLHSLALPLAFALQIAVGRWRHYRRNGGNGLERDKRNQKMDETKAKSINNNALIYAPTNNDGNSSRPTARRDSFRRSHNQQKQPNGTPTSPLIPLPYWLCSTQQIMLIVACLGMALLFTAFDQEPARPKLMVNCSIALAIRQKGLAFSFLSLLLLSQLLQMAIWYFLAAAQQSKNAEKKKKKKGEMKSLIAYLVLSCRDLFLAESIGWSLVALLTGLSLVHQFIWHRPCTKCTRLAIELSFTTLPLLIALAHSILSLLFIAPIRYSAQRFCPILRKLFPTQELITPPLPRPFPTVRILITEH